jgi:hypothetical protein
MRASSAMISRTSKPRPLNSAGNAGGRLGAVITTRSSWCFDSLGVWCGVWWPQVCNGCSSVCSDCGRVECTECSSEINCDRCGTDQVCKACFISLYGCLLLMLTLCVWGVVSLCD